MTRSPRERVITSAYSTKASAVERAGIAGQDYVHGFSELPRVPYIEGDLTDVQGMSVENLESMVDVTVTAELANNSVYVLKEAWCRSAIEINSREGQFRVRFEGTTCEELF